MQSKFAFIATALAATVFTVAAQAQTGRPAAVEVNASSDAPHAVSSDDQLGSYGRYLMLNGATRDEALSAARNVDHPAARRRVARNEHATADVKAPIRQ